MTPRKMSAATVFALWPVARSREETVVKRHCRAPDEPSGAQACARGVHLEESREVMQWWADNIWIHTGSNMLCRTV